MSLRIAALVKQIPAFESMTLGTDGRLVREGLELEMSAYCRRAVSQAVRIAHDAGGSVTVITLGPPAAEDVLREAIAWGRDHDVEIDGVLVTDARFAGSDTLATARALTATITLVGPFDLILTGRNSVDADTGQVGPQVAELLGWPFVTGARHLALAERRLDIRAEHDDGWAQVRVDLPAVVSTAERLIDPCKVDPDGRGAVPADRIRTVGADDLGPGPWGGAASPTSVGETRMVPSVRLGRRAPELGLDVQIDRAVAVLVERGALDAAPDGDGESARRVPARSDTGRLVGVLVEPERARIARELLGAASELGGPVVALVVAPGAPTELGDWGADTVVSFTHIPVANEEDSAGAITGWARATSPWALLAPGTAWGREVAGRVAAALGTGLTGDAVQLDRDGDDARGLEARLRWSDRGRDPLRDPSPDGDGPYRRPPGAYSPGRDGDPCRHLDGASEPAGGARPHQGRRPRSAGRRRCRRDGGSGSGSVGLPAARRPARRARRGARGNPQGHRPGMAPPGSSDRYHRDARSLHGCLSRSARAASSTT